MPIVDQAHAFAASVAAVWAHHVLNGTATEREKRLLLQYLQGKEPSDG